ncbi:MAG: hypothetical protein HOI95_11775, partial [Chromatiales bacterium]|nr:hypothetical protein [Chromatiales bacterium]
MADSPQRPTALAGTRRLAGYHTLPAWDPYEDYVGPMYERVSDDGVRCAMEIEARHC